MASLHRIASLFITVSLIGVSVPMGPLSVAHAATIVSESFGTSSSGSLPSPWSDGGNSGADAEARAAGSGNDSASPNGGRFGIAFGENGWFCRMVTTTGYTGVELSYYWRGDNDAESNDHGIVEIRTTPGSSCTSSSGWTTLATHDLSQDNSWTTQSALTHAAMNNGSFALRFRVDSSNDDEHFRVDGISITGSSGDTTAPTVSSVTSSTANGAYNAGDSISIQVTFSETVLVTGTPQITLETGSTDRVGSYVSGSNSAIMTFAYTVQGGDTSSDLDYVSTGALSLNGGTIKDAAGNNAVMTLAAPGAANSLGANKAIVIDTTAPVLAQVTPVPSVTNDATPNYTFSSTEAGTITYAGGCTSGTTNALVGNNTVTFAMLADGTYGSCTIVATDVAGNQSSALAVSSFAVDTAAPVITIAGDNPLELGTGDTFTDPGATALDAHDGSVSVTASGSVNTATPGTYNITYGAVDVAGNAATAIRAVNVSDDDAPVFSGVPAAFSAEATGPGGATVSYVMPSAADNVDGDVSGLVSCSPVSMSTFPLGTTVVGCSVSDSVGNTATASFSVTVEDTTMPTITTSGDQTIEATGPTGATATFTVSADDTVSGDVSSSIVCDALSGNTFALGATVVTCTAEDAAGNVATATFTVTVEDTTAPTISIDPSGISMQTIHSAGDMAHFSTTEDDIVDTDLDVVCTPESGMVFAPGATLVTCTATDDSLNTGTATMTVTVEQFDGTGGSTDRSPLEFAEAPEVADVPVVPEVADVPAVEPAAPEAQGEVLGASCVQLTSYVGMGDDSPDDVRLVQEFLNTELGLTLAVNGVYDAATKDAVKGFQIKYASDILAPWIPFGHDGTTPTGIVYKTTQYWMNKISCPDLDIPMPTLP